MLQYPLKLCNQVIPNPNLAGDPLENMPAEEDDGEAETFSFE